jgi:chromosome segregation ATPase
MLQHKQKKQAVEFEPKVEVVEVIKEVPASIPEGSILVDVGEYERMSDMISRADRDSATADDERAALNRMIEEQAAQLELIKTEKTKLLAQIEEMAESDRVEDAAHSRLEIALQHQASRLKEDVKQAEQDLAIALDALEKRDTKIENLERHSAELEQQIVELRMQLRKFEMTATERAKLHQQNVVQAKNN